MARNTTPNITRIIQQLKNPKPFLEQVGRQFVAIIRERFDSTKKDPDGRKWRRWAPATARARLASGTTASGILVLSGRMRNGNRYTASRTQLMIRNTAPYAEFHQDGTRRMPARKFIGYGPLERKAVQQLWSKWVNARK